MHLFVTGGTGFFGKALLRYWSATNYAGIKVTVLSRDPARFASENPTLAEHPNLDFVDGDVTRPETLPRDGDFTHVIHAAAESTKGPALRALERYDHSVAGTRNVLDLAVRVRASRVLLTSTGGVYGRFPAGVDAVSEDYLGMPDPLVPDNAYSLAKIASEHLCSLYADIHGVEPVIARCFAFSGRDLPLDAHYAIGNFVRDAAAGAPIVVNGDGSPVRSYLDQHDLAHWLLTLLTVGIPGRAYNVGSDRAITIAELAQTVAELARTGSEPQIKGDPEPNPVRNRYVPDISRARQELGLDVTVTLADSLRQMFKAAA